MAAKKPAARSGSTRQRQQQRASAARTGATASTRSTRNGATAGQSRASANGATGNRTKSATAARAAADQRTGSRAATAVQPVPRSGPFGRLLSFLTAMGGVPLATLVLSLYGFGASIYLTLAHYDTSIHLACADNSLVNCEAVTTSPQSILFGVFPVAVLGLAFYVFMVAVNSPWGWRLSVTHPMVRYARLGSVIVGMGFVLYLIYAELIEINAICLWCTSVHVATFLIFALVIFRSSFPAASTSTTPRR
jgi:uncharacterized membrane protein